MATKNEVALTIVDPGNRRWAQLVDLAWLVEDVLPLLVKRLELPDSLQYNLTDVDSGRKLDVSQSLLGSGIAAGAVLQLSPVHNKVLTDLLDKLYDEAVGYVAKQLWGQAEARLELIKRLDPTYPDPQGVALALVARSATTATSAAAGASAQATSGATTGTSTTDVAGGAGYDSAAGSAGYSAASSAGYESASTTASHTAAASRSASRGVLGCLVASLVLVALMVAVGISAVRSLQDGIDLASLPVIGPYFADEEGLPEFRSPDEPALGTGDVQVTLRWDNAADLDLHVFDPSGSEVYYDNPFVASGGELDVDANGTCENNAPVENVFWTSGAAPDGRYDVSVVYFGNCGVFEPSDYVVTVRVDGQVVQTWEGTLDASAGSHEVGSFER